MKKLLLALNLFLLALLACALPQPVFDSHQSPMTTPFTPTTTVTISNTECGWNWATQALPGETAELQAALEAAGLETATAWAEAFGENCFGADGGVRYFSAMETDYRIQLEVDSITDRPALGQQLGRVLAVLDGFPVGSTPGPNPGYVGVVFVSGSESLRLWFLRTEGESARRAGLQGAALLDTLTVP